MILLNWKKLYQPLDTILILIGVVFVLKQETDEERTQPHAYNYQCNGGEDWNYKVRV